MSRPTHTNAGIVTADASVRHIADHRASDVEAGLLGRRPHIDAHSRVIADN